MQVEKKNLLIPDLIILYLHFQLGTINFDQS